MPARIVRLVHRYSCLPSWYGVRTEMSRAVLETVCVYLQLLRAELPHFASVDDTLSEDDVVALLAAFYGCEPIVSDDAPFAAADVLDLYVVECLSARYAPPHDCLDIRHGRQDVVCAGGPDSIARAGARLAIVDAMRTQAERFARNGDCPADCRDALVLGYMRKGLSVPRQWGLHTHFDAAPYVGALAVGGALDWPRGWPAQRSQLRSDPNTHAMPVPAGLLTHVRTLAARTARWLRP